MNHSDLIAIVAAILYNAQADLAHREAGSSPDIAECVNTAHEITRLSALRATASDDLPTRWS